MKCIIDVGSCESDLQMEHGPFCHPSMDPDHDDDDDGFPSPVKRPNTCGSIHKGKTRDCMSPTLRSKGHSSGNKSEKVHKLEGLHLDLFNSVKCM